MHACVHDCMTAWPPRPTWLHQSSTSAISYAASSSISAFHARDAAWNAGSAATPSSADRRAIGSARRSRRPRTHATAPAGRSCRFQHPRQSEAAHRLHARHARWRCLSARTRMAACVRSLARVRVSLTRARRRVLGEHRPRLASQEQALHLGDVLAKRRHQAGALVRQLLRDALALQQAFKALQQLERRRERRAVVKRLRADGGSDGMACRRGRARGRVMGGADCVHRLVRRLACCCDQSCWQQRMHAPGRPRASHTARRAPA